MKNFSKKLAIFDLDGTITASKAPIDSEMAELITVLLKKSKVAIITGGGFPQIQMQFLAGLPGDFENMNNLFLLPASGTRLYVWRGSWIQEYSESLTPVEKDKILNALSSALTASNFVKPERVYGQLIEDRGSQITFSALGQSAPVSEKSLWDPKREKRQRITSFLSPKLPDFDVRIGGSTSIDITKKGINKSYGIRKLEQYLKLQTDDIVFVGDSLFLGGNDYPAKATGVDCIQVNSLNDTKNLIRSWLQD